MQHKIAKVTGDIHSIPEPFLLYTGNAQSVAESKTAAGVLEWTDKAVGVISDFPSLLYPSVPNFNNLQQAKNDIQAKTVVICVTTKSPEIEGELEKFIIKAMKLGYNIASGLHSKLVDNDNLVQLALIYGTKLYDFRHRPIRRVKGTGEKRDGIRVLTVGTDCCCGKKYTALSIYNAIKGLVPTVFCATGQTGFLISGRGINNDTITADFLSGEAELLSPVANPGTVYIIEGQGAMRHPSFSAGSMSLLSGSQPDFLVMCHATNTGLEQMRNTSRSINVVDEIEANMQASKIHGLTPELIGISINGDIPEEPLYKDVPMFNVPRNTHTSINSPTANKEFSAEFRGVCARIVLESNLRSQGSTNVA